jgi:hypothetical protein
MSVMGLFCRLGWHRWTEIGGRVVCPRCRTAAVASRPRLVRIASWSLAGIAVVSLVRVVLALIVAPHVDEAEARYAAVVGEIRTAVFEARDVLNYSVFAGFALAAVLVPVLVALRGPLGGARWAAVVVLCTSLMGQVVYIASDLSGPLRWRIVPGWYPLTQQLIEVALLLASAAVVVILLHGTSREYFEEGVADVDADDAMERALAAVRQRRAAEQ